MLVGGIKHRHARPSTRTAANVQSTMLFLAAAALLMPAIFELVEGKGLPSPSAELVDYGSTVEQLSLAVAIVLIGTYVAGLFFSLRTHKDLFNPPYAEEHEEGFGWSVRRVGDRPLDRRPRRRADVGDPRRLDLARRRSRSGSPSSSSA